MPDISMCGGKNCPLSKKCYRFTATPSEYLQSWFMEEPYDTETKTCYFYLEVERATLEVLTNAAKTVGDIYAARAERNKRLKNKTNES